MLRRPACWRRLCSACPTRVGCPAASTAARRLTPPCWSSAPCGGSRTRHLRSRWRRTGGEGGRELWTELARQGCAIGAPAGLWSCKAQGRFGMAGSGMGGGAGGCSSWQRPDLPNRSHRHPVPQSKVRVSCRGQASRGGRGRGSSGRGGRGGRSPRRGGASAGGAAGIQGGRPARGAARGHARRTPGVSVGWAGSCQLPMVPQFTAPAMDP
jgi:hypothetical protein